MSYLEFGGDSAGFDPSLAAYVKLIEEMFPGLCRMSARTIDKYLTLYGINVNKSADEFKLIYFLGRAIEKHLLLLGLADVAQVHMFTMVGLLDYKLKTLGYEKKILVRALLKLIRVGTFDDELGPTGCYLIYKCSSTAVPDPKVANQHSISDLGKKAGDLN